MADQTEVERQYREWLRTLPKCVGWAGGCDGNLPHKETCPMFGKKYADQQDIYAAGYEAGARDMRARAANEIEGQREGGKMTNVVQVFDVLGSAVRSLPLTEGK